MEIWNRVWDNRDKRTDGLFLMDSIVPNLLLTGSYILLVTVIGPRFMKNRPAYNLKIPIMVYNLLQIIFCSFLVIKGGAKAWLTTYSWVCQPVEQSAEPDSTSMWVLYASWWYFLNKYSDYMDTFFFVARKKFNQVTTLHVYHHAIMPLYAWCHVRWLPGGHEILAGYINTGVHVVMYLYYFLSAFGPQMQPYLWWKKYITVLQLVQFVFCFCHSGILVLGIAECGYPWQASLFSMIFLHVPFFVMFMKFYMKSYNKGVSKKDVRATNGYSKALKDE